MRRGLRGRRCPAVLTTGMSSACDAMWVGVGRAQAPDEFIDPIMGCLLMDPVVLPHSRQTVDRTTIMQHLLNDPHDPFNRMPLKAEDLTPNDELKAQVHAWLKAKRTERAAARAEAARDATAAAGGDGDDA